jgi:mono/diheme cytochrome c family protein
METDMGIARLSLATIGLVIAATQVHGQEAGDRQKGRVLARQVCAECHTVGRQVSRSPNAEAPSFVAVASTPGMTEMALNVFFQTSHRNMPNFILTADQRKEIIAYILSLKR